MISVGSHHVQRILSGKSESRDEMLAAEQILQISINDNPYTITMRTPGNEHELVRGLLHAEDVITRLKGPFRIETTCIDENGIITAVNLHLDPDETGPGLQSERNLVSVSSCGMCGKREIDTLSPKGTPLETDVVISPGLVQKMFGMMAEKQSVFQITGGSHASAAFSADGTLLTVMEDIGRHNAVDKVSGSLLLAGIESQAKVLLVSGRVSYEIIIKAFKAGIPFLAAVSAPSTLAVEMSQNLGITLMAFCRGDKMTVYSHQHRVTL